MRRFYKPKSKLPKKRLANFSAKLKKLDKTAQALMRTDLQLHRAKERLDQQIFQMHALHRVGTLINSTFDLEKILNVVSESMNKDLGFDKTGIVFLEQKGQKPMQSAYCGFTPGEYRHFLDHFEALLLPALRREEEVFLETDQDAPEEWAIFLKSLSLSSVLLLPMRIKSSLIGFIVGGHSHMVLRLSDIERRFYCMYATQASTAAENARLYEALGQANLSLEEKVQERTRNLIQANERLRELDTAKSNFISLVSHELRTPLTAIKGLVSNMLNFDSEILEQKRHVYLNVLNEETDRLTRLITDLLDVSRIESGRFEFNWGSVSVPERVQRVFTTLSFKAERVNRLKDFQEDFPHIGADGDKLEQVLVNLVENAIRYSPPGSAITVSGRRQGEGVILQVADQGPGIPFDQLEKIFDEFYRLDNDINRKHPGTGLGLSICRALINLHGGNIWAESELGQGTRFRITLPLHWDKLQASGAAPVETLPETPRLHIRPAAS